MRPAAHLLFFVSPKKSRQKKGDPAGRVPCASLRGNLRCSDVGRRCGTRFVHCVHFAQTTAASQIPHLSPLGWEHINLTGDYIWRQNKQVGQGKFRPLRMPGEA